LLILSGFGSQSHGKLHWVPAQQQNSWIFSFMFLFVCLFVCFFFFAFFKSIHKSLHKLQCIIFI
jgi:hypothetical protein